jgi:hypothetical protein
VSAGASSGFGSPGRSRPPEWNPGRPNRPGNGGGGPGNGGGGPGNGGGEPGGGGNGGNGGNGGWYPYYPYYPYWGWGYYGFYDPFWPYPYYYPYGVGLGLSYGYYSAPPVVVESVGPPDEYLNAPPDGGTPPEQFWYYCQDPAGFYPYVRMCNGEWEAVPAAPPGAPASEPSNVPGGQAPTGPTAEVAPGSN